MQAVIKQGMLFRVGAVVSLIGGTMFLMWLGEQITSRGRGQRHQPHHHGGHRRASCRRRC
ncbi:hypothetical protein AB5I41_30000 [Sphingomonas sp. MMS24-JH45]